MRSDSYSDPELWEMAKREAVRRLGGRHSARAMQLAGHLYRSAGGDYIGPKTQAQRSLSKWTAEDWRTVHGGKACHRTSRGVRCDRYLPSAAWELLSPAQVAATRATKKRSPRQYVPNEPAALEAGRLAREATPRSNPLPPPVRATSRAMSIPALMQAYARAPAQRWALAAVRAGRMAYQAVESAGALPDGADMVEDILNYAESYAESGDPSQLLALENELSPLLAYRVQEARDRARDLMWKVTFEPQPYYTAQAQMFLLYFAQRMLRRDWALACSDAYRVLRQPQFGYQSKRPSGKLEAAEEMVATAIREALTGRR